MSKGSILVVDDEAEIREGLELLLDSEGYGVSSAETGEAGLARLEEQPFDLLLLDVSLPDRNGLDLLREIRRRDPDLSVVLITAYGSIDMARAAFKSWRAGLHHQAVVQRRIAGAGGAGRRRPPAARRKRSAQARAEAALRLPQHHRQERKNAARCSIW